MFLTFHYVVASLIYKLFNLMIKNTIIINYRVQWDKIKLISLN